MRTALMLDAWRRSASGRAAAVVAGSVRQPRDDFASTASASRDARPATSADYRARLARTPRPRSASDGGSRTGADADNPLRCKRFDRADTSRLEKTAGNTGSNETASGDLLRGLEMTSCGDQR